MKFCIYKHACQYLSFKSFSFTIANAWRTNLHNINCSLGGLGRWDSSLLLLPRSLYRSSWEIQKTEISKTWFHTRDNTFCFHSIAACTCTTHSQLCNCKFQETLQPSLRSCQGMLCTVCIATLYIVSSRSYLFSSVLSLVPV